MGVCVTKERTYPGYIYMGYGCGLWFCGFIPLAVVGGTILSLVFMAPEEL
jgi:hypothetical protein